MIATAIDVSTGVEIAHVDAHCIVAIKPAGLLAVPGRGEAGLDCLSQRVRARFADTLVVHRLDMSTSGLMLFARGIQAQRSLSAAFAAREVHKRYVAVVSGEVAADIGEVDLLLSADWPNRPRQQVDRANGKPSLTRWRVLSREAGTTRLELEPVTGRAHQLRVHLLAIGHPILGDALYADEAARTRAARLLLHASSLAFAHPFDASAMQLASPPPF